MAKCKVCGMVLYHISKAHIATHDMTKEEYDKLPYKPMPIQLVPKQYTEADVYINNATLDSMHKKRRCDTGYFKNKCHIR